MRVVFTRLAHGFHVGILMDISWIPCGVHARLSLHKEKPRRRTGSEGAGGSQAAARPIGGDDGGDAAAPA